VVPSDDGTWPDEAMHGAERQARLSSIRNRGFYRELTTEALGLTSATSWEEVGTWGLGFGDIQAAAWDCYVVQASWVQTD
jgi:hypothetical protein